MSWFIHIGGIQVDTKVAGHFEWFAWNLAHDSACIPWVGSRMAFVLNLAISGGYACSCFEGVQLCPFQLGETDTAPSFLQTMDGSTVFGIQYSFVAFSEFSMFANPCFVAAVWDDDLSSKTSAEFVTLFLNGFGYGWYQFFSTNTMIPSPKTVGWWLVGQKGLQRSSDVNLWWLLRGHLLPSEGAMLKNPSWTTVLLLFFFGRLVGYGVLRAGVDILADWFFIAVTPGNFLSKLCRKSPNFIWNWALRLWRNIGSVVFVALMKLSYNGLGWRLSLGEGMCHFTSRSTKQLVAASAMAGLFDLISVTSIHCWIYHQLGTPRRNPGCKIMIWQIAGKNKQHG